jgi:hypothetical protein
MDMRTLSGNCDEHVNDAVKTEGNSGIFTPIQTALYLQSATQVQLIFH